MLATVRSRSSELPDYLGFVRRKRSRPSPRISTRSAMALSLSKANLSSTPRENSGYNRLNYITRRFLGRAAQPQGPQLLLGRLDEPTESAGGFSDAGFWYGPGAFGEVASWLTWTRSVQRHQPDHKHALTFDISTTRWPPRCSGTRIPGRRCGSPAVRSIHSARGRVTVNFMVTRSRLSLRVRQRFTWR